MSTTVTYKGSTLTTASDQTRVLKTAGKYLEDDITIVDVGLEDGDNLGYGVDRLTDLTGTSWYLNDAPDVSDDVVYFITFTSDETVLDGFELSNNNGDGEIAYYVNGVPQILVYHSGGWNYAVYRFISITGGTDATNADFITWLMANATQVS